VKIQQWLLDIWKEAVVKPSSLQYMSLYKNSDGYNKGMDSSRDDSN